MSYRTVLRSNLKRDAAKRLFRQKQGEFRETFLAVVNGAVMADMGRMWVHDLASVDANGAATYGAPYKLPLFPGAAVDPQPNWKVNVITFKGKEYIWSMDIEDMDRAGYDGHQTNPLNPRLKYISTRMIQEFLALPNGDDTARVEPGVYQKPDGTFNIYTAGASSPYVDLLTEYVPASTDDSTIVCLWLDTYDNAVVVTQSSEFETSPSIFYTPSEALTYINEAAADRPPDAIPLGTFLITGETTVMDISTLFWDLRPFLRPPAALGFPQTLTTQERVQDNRTVLLPPYTTSGVGAVTLESGARITIVPHTNWTATADPTTSSDSTQGYSVGSRWINVSASPRKYFVCLNPAAGAAVWLRVGSFLSFTAAADSGTPVVLEDGETLSVVGTGGIATSISGNTITVDGSAIGGAALPFDDDEALLQNATDTTKKARFDASVISTGQTRVYTLPDATTTIVGTDTTQNLTNKTISASSLIATALSLLIGGFKAIFSHSNTADRTYTLPDYDGTLATRAGTETLTNKTIDGDDNTLSDIPLSAIKTVGANTKRLISRDASGVISDATSPAFDNANHDHTNSAGGGQLNASSVFSAGTVPLARGGTNADLSATGGTGHVLKQASVGANITTGTVGTTEIADDAITNAKLANNAVNTAEITDNAVTNAKLADNAVDTAEIADNAVTLAKLAHGTAGKVIGFDGSGVPSEITVSSGFTPARWRTGLELRAPDTSTILVGAGELTVNGTLVEKTGVTTLALGTGSNWIGGASAEAASEFVWLYADASGNLKLHNKAPNYTRPNTADRIATMLVNQSGWNGTAGSGLNATSVVYDNDTGEGSITAGMLAVIYASSDSDYSLGRGRGSGAAGSRNNISAALITAINTGTNTLTLEAGHNIAINDNDRIIVVPYGAFEYRDESGTWYRLIGAMWNNSSSDLATDRTNKRSAYILNESGDYTTTATSFTDVDATKLYGTVLATGSDVECGFAATIQAGLPDGLYFTYSVDGTTPSEIADNGIGLYYQPTASTLPMMTVRYLIRAMLPGTHTVILRWRTLFGSSSALYAGAGSTNTDLHPQLTVRVL